MLFRILGVLCGVLSIIYGLTPFIALIVGGDTELIAGGIVFILFGIVLIAVCLRPNADKRKEKREKAAMKIETTVSPERLQRIRSNPIIIEIAQKHANAVSFSFFHSSHYFMNNALHVFYDTCPTTIDFTKHNYKVDSLHTQYCILEALRSLLPQPETYKILRVCDYDYDHGDTFYYMMYTTRFDTEHRYWDANAYGWGVRNLKTF